MTNNTIPWLNLLKDQESSQDTVSPELHHQIRCLTLAHFFIASRKAGLSTVVIDNHGAKSFDDFARVAAKQLTPLPSDHPLYPKDVKLLSSILAHSKYEVRDFDLVSPYVSDTYYATHKPALEPLLLKCKKGLREKISSLQEELQPLEEEIDYIKGYDPRFQWKKARDVEKKKLKSTKKGGRS